MGWRIALVLGLVLPALLSGGRAVQAQSAAALEIALDRTQVTVGDRIQVTVTLRLPAGAQAQLAGIERQFGELDALVIGLPEDRNIGNGMHEVTVKYEVAAFRTGEVPLPTVTVSYADANGDVKSLASAPQTVTVTSVLPADEAPTTVRDLKPPLDLTFRTATSPHTVVMITLAVVAGVAALGLAGLLIWRRLRRVPPPPAPVVVVRHPADVVARTELERIAGLGLIESGDTVQLHGLLATCIRRYLSQRYEFPATSMTTSELRGQMERNGVGRWQARLALGLLTECDAVAYARYAPATARAEANLAMAYEVVSLPDAAPSEAEMMATTS